MKSSVAVSQETLLLPDEASPATYPRLLAVQGAWLLAYTVHGPCGRTVRIAVSSSPEGPFEECGTVASARVGEDVDNLHVLWVPGGKEAEKDDGKLLAAYRHHTPSPFAPEDWRFRIALAESLDMGRTWTPLPEHVHDQVGRWGQGAWEPFLRTCKDGSVGITYSLETSLDNQVTVERRSHDLGRTWTPPRVITAHGGLARDGMTGLISAPESPASSSTTTIIFETTVLRDGFHHFHIACATSHDDGLSWNDRADVHRPPTGYNSGAPQITALPDGRFVAVWMSDVGLPLEQVDHPRRERIMFSYSLRPRRRSSALRWSRPVVLSELGSFWPGVAVSQNGDVLVVYERGGALQMRWVTLPSVDTRPVGGVWLIRVLLGSLAACFGVTGHA